jgi:hypothetical protein
MIKNRYIVYDENQPIELQDDLNKITTIRIGKISEILTSDKPSLIPFDYKFPIIKSNDYSGFLNETMKQHLFENLPNFIKDDVYKAEQINFYNLRFLKYLKAKKMSESEFENKNPKIKQDIFYDFLFSNKLDIGIITL